MLRYLEPSLIFTLPGNFLVHKLYKNTSSIWQVRNFKRLSVKNGQARCQWVEGLSNVSPVRINGLSRRSCEHLSRFLSDDCEEMEEKLKADRGSSGMSVSGPRPSTHRPLLLDSCVYPGYADKSWTKAIIMTNEVFCQKNMTRKRLGRCFFKIKIPCLCPLEFWFYGS